MTAGARCVCASLVLTLGCGNDASPPPKSGAAASGADEAAPMTHAVRFVAGDDLGFEHQPSRSEDRFLYEIMGSGLAIVDVNRDGAPDLVIVNCGTPTVERPASARNRLYLNDGGGGFTDVTESWNLGGAGYGMGIATGDLDGDGWTDLFLSAFGRGERLLRNTGSGFEDGTTPVLVDPEWSTSAGVFDLENDGDLDLYVSRYIEYSTENAIRCYVNQVHTYCTPDLYEAMSDRVLRNDGGGRFTDVSDAVGVGAIRAKSLAVLLADIDGDRDVDVYVANDLSRNNLLMNEDGVFNDIGLESGVGYSENGKEEAGMGADLADVNDDGREDLVVTNFQAEPNSVYLQTGNLLFRERSDALGIGASTRARLGFGCDFADVDNDGDEDLLFANGHIDDRVSEHTGTVTFPQPNMLFLDTGDRFVDITSSAGPAFEDRQVSRGLATGDLDSDGDLDVVIVNNGGTVQIARNDSATGSWASLWLEGRESNPDAIGTRVEVTTETGLAYTRHVVGASSYLSVSDRRVHLGLGTASGARVRILWPSGLDQEIDVEAGTFIHIVEGRDPEPYVPGKETRPPAR